MSLGLIVVQALAFAGWWSWDGGVAWGPRFLLPILPLMTVAIVPILDRSRQRRLLFVAIGTLVLLSLMLQVLGAFYSYFPYYTYCFIR